MQINFGITKPELVNSFSEGYNASHQERAQRAELDRLQQERRMMLDFQNSLKAAGKDTNLNTYFDKMISSGIPEYVEKGLMGKQKLDEQQKFARIMGLDLSGSPTDQAPSIQNSLVSQTQQSINPSTAQLETDYRINTPVNNAMVSPNKGAVPNQAPSSTNAMDSATTSQTIGRRSGVNPVASQFGQDQIATITDRINKLMVLGTPQAVQTAKILQDQLEMVSRQKGSTEAKILPPGAIMVDPTGRQIAINPRSAASVSGAVANTSPVKLKPGEFYNAQLDRVEAKPGSEMYVKQSKEHAKDYKAVTGTSLKMNDAIAKIDNLLAPSNKHAFEGNFGGYNAYGTRMLPGKNSDLRKDIDSLKSNLKNAGLELMRQGGSIGQMTEKEWPIVEQMIESIDPVLSEDRARKIFENIKMRFEHIRDSAKDVYDTQWGQTQYHKGLNSGNRISRNEGAMNPDDKQALDWANANPNDPRSIAIKQRLGVK